jgi:exodeoxyribonuclease-1
VAPIGALKDTAVQERLQLPVETVQKHLNKLAANKEFTARVVEAIERVEAGRIYDDAPLGDLQAVDSQLYNGFISKPDCQQMKQLRETDPKDFKHLNPTFQDPRLQSLLPLYRARNYPQLLSSDERQAWDEFCRIRVMEGGQNSRLGKYFKRIDELAHQDNLTENQRYALEELQLYGQSIMPADE